MWRWGVLIVVLGSLTTVAWTYRNHACREHSLAMAKKYGSVEDVAFVPARRLVVILRSRQGVNQVLPLLNAVPDMTELTFYKVALSGKDLRLICQLNHLSALQINQCELRDDDLRFLSTIVVLRELELAGNPITDDGLKHLSTLTSLRTLGLAGTLVKGPGLASINPDLTWLRLQSTAVDDDSIASCTRFRHLSKLELAKTQITEDGLMKLVDLHWLTAIGPPEDVSGGARQRFRDARDAATEADRRAGKEVPPQLGRPNNRKPVEVY